MSLESPTPENNIEQRTQRIKELQKQIADTKAAIEVAENAERERKYQTGEWERPVQPKQSGFGEFAPGLRKAIRTMRGTEEVESWYRYAPAVFKNSSIPQNVLQGVWNDVRKSEKFDAGFKETVARTKKREYILDSGDLTLGFDPNVTQKIAEYQKDAMETLRKDTNKRLTLQGPERFFETWGKRGRWVDDDREEHGSVSDLSIAERYQNLITAHNARFATSEEEKVSDTVTKDEARTVRFPAGQNMYDQVSQNLADDEFTMMSGMFRDLWIVMRNLDVNQLQHYSKRDLDVKIPIVEFFIREFKNDILGNREMTKKNANIFSWFVNMGGQNFIPFNEISPDLKDWYEIIKSIVGRRDARSQPSVYGRINEYGPTGVDAEKKKKSPLESPAMARINELRAERNLPPMTEKTQPFGRFGIVA